MNEEELKELWQTDKAAPTLDFARIKKLSTDWQAKLRRKAQIDAWAQISVAVLFLLPAIYRPKMIFASLLILLLGVWYFRQLRELYRLDSGELGELVVKQTIEKKIETLRNFFRQTRILLYTAMPLIMIASLYGYDILNEAVLNSVSQTFTFLRSIIVAEIVVIVCTEIYFKILYKPAFDELKNLLRQLNFDE